MAALIGTLFAASFLDCLNPTAIAQQLLLQASLEKKRKIWFFIAGMFLTNLALGLVVYYGAAEPLLRLWRRISDSRPALAASLLLAFGILCLTAGGLLSLRVLRSRRRKGEGTEDKEGAKLPRRELSCPVLFGLGVAFTGAELTSALPYFGFLGAMAAESPHAAVVVLLTAVYSLVYILPLILLCFAYNALGKTRAIAGLERVMGKVSAWILPAVFVLFGVFSVVKGISGLL